MLSGTELISRHGSDAERSSCVEILRAYVEMIMSSKPVNPLVFRQDLREALPALINMFYQPLNR